MVNTCRESRFNSSLPLQEEQTMCLPIKRCTPGPTRCFRIKAMALPETIKFIKFNCVVCKKIEKELTGQVMVKLPEEHLKPAPPWSSTAIDLFGPFKIRNEVKKRTIRKAFGVVFNCLATQAVHVDLSPDYSAEKFQIVLQRFVSLRVYLAKLRSDNGTQLTAANEELQTVTQACN